MKAECLTVAILYFNSLPIKSRFQRNLTSCRYNLLLGSTDSSYPLLPAPDNLISRWSIGLGKLGIVLSLAS